MSRRAEYRRQERNNRRPLSDNEIARLNKQRALPADHPSFTKSYLRLVPLAMSLDAIDVVERSGMVPYWERRLRSHPGKKSELSLLALLVVMLIAEMSDPSYCRTDLCAVLHGLDAQAAYKLGLCSRVAHKMLSYNVINKQCLRFEKALDAGWVDKDGTNCDYDWFAHCLLKANITPELAEQIAGVALDWTDVPTWAVPFSYPEGENRTEGPSSADPDAAWGYRSGTNKTAADLFYGFCGHIACGVRPSDWKGQVGNANLGGPVPLIPLHVTLTPANANVAQAGLNTIDWPRKLVNVKEVAADRGYTLKNENFNRPLHTDEINVVMDYDIKAKDKVEALCLGRNKHRLIENCGTFFPAWLPKDLRTPPEGLTDAQLAEWYDQRAKYRYSSTPLAGGKIQLVCPQCAGRIRSNKKTRKKNVKANNNALYIHIKNNATYCCPGKVTVPVKYLDRYQKAPYGTTAWKGSYGRRLQIENCNSILKDKGGLQSRWCRALGLAPRFVAIVMLCVAVGMRATRPDLDDSRNPVDEEILNEEDEELLNDEDETGTDPQQEPPSGLGDSQSEDRSRDGPV